MKNFTRLSFLFLTFIFSIQSFSQSTFDFETAVIDSGNDKIVTQTVDGITMTLVGPSSAGLYTYNGGQAGFTGKAYHATNGGGPITLTFSSPINPTSLRAGSPDWSNNGDWVFTPDGAGNSPVTLVNVLAGVSGGATADLSAWTNVTTITITSPVACCIQYALDTIVFTGALGINDFASNTAFKFYPNPTTDTVNLSATKKIDNVVLYNLLGQKVLDQKIGAISSQLNITNLSKGTYIMEVSIDGQLGNYKINKN